MEKWKPVPNEQNYSVSNKGRIKNIVSNTIKQSMSDKDGYKYVILWPSRKSYRVHRLVMKTFTPESEWKEQVNHKDFDKANNNIKNLEWNTPKENIQHYYKFGNVPNRKGDNSPAKKLSLSQVEEIILKLQKKHKMPSLSKEYNVSLSTIERIKYGESW